MKLFAAIFAASVAAVPASAQGSMSDADLCLKNHQEGEEIGINACTKLIDAKTGSAIDRAAYFGMRGIRLWGAEDRKGAEADLAKAISMAAAPMQKAAFLTARAQLYMSAKVRAKAVADLDAAIAADPAFAPAYLFRGELFDADERFAEALMYYDKSIELDRKNPDALNNACWVRAADLRKDFAKARTLCDEALTLEPGNANTLDSRGMVGLQQRNWGAAFRDYDASVKAAPKAASPLYGRGLAAIALGRHQQGQADLDAAVKMDATIAADYAKRGLSPQDVAGLSSGW